MKALKKYLSVAIVALAALMLAGRAMVPSVPEGKKDLYSFGQIPVQHGGRIQPIDSVARSSLTIISGKQEFEDPTDNDRKYKAIDWLLIVWANTDQADKFRIFRVEHPQLLGLLDLPQRPGSYRYSIAELEPKIQELETRASAAGRKEKEDRTLFDEKVMELARHVQVYRELEYRVVPGITPIDDPSGKWQSISEAFRMVASSLEKDLRAKADREVREQLNAPGAIADLEHRFQEAKLEFNQQNLEMFLKAQIDKRFRSLLVDAVRKELPKAYPQAGAMEKIAEAYRGENATEFNDAVNDYKQKYTAEISDGDLRRVRFEARMNFFDPFLQCAALYVGVGILAVLSWLVGPWEKPLNRAAYHLAWLTFTVHTAALLTRMYIGVRPPVTNLYSSAVFIGWGGLGLGLILERIYRNGVGSVAAAVLGFCTMLIARFLSESGDTLEMLQAVLDTNFWLATHVTCVTLGYVATLMAGLIACIYVFRGLFTSGLAGEPGKRVAGMIYGTLCFATLLSFTGTVLGGIWADQSWGRFWGWDPKENGAVLIVIWNSLILHARWGGLVKARGMAVLAVFGNMVAIWSWFGTNQLGIGLHAYGFDTRLADGCALFWVSQVLIAALGMVPLRFWASFGPTAKS